MKPRSSGAQNSDSAGCDGAVIRILVAVGQSIDRKGLVALLADQPDFRVIAEAESASEAVARCRRLQPDLLLLATGIADLLQDSVISSVRRASPGTRIVALADRSGERCAILNPPARAGVEGSLSESACESGTDCLQIAVAQGARGAIRRDASLEDLYDAVRTVARGSVWYEDGNASRLLEGVLGNAGGTTRQSLTARELEVAALISGGKSNKSIAAELGITEPTVKKHVGHILSKLELKDRLQLGLLVARNPLSFSPGIPARG